MRLIRGLRNLRRELRGSVVTIGTFDGLHLGHRALVDRLREHAARRSRPAMMLTFEPTPREYFAPSTPPARLTSLRERYRMLTRLQLDAMCVLRFDERLRSLSGEEFAGLLARQFEAPAVVVGHDFRFGREGGATADMLAEAGKRLGFEVDVVAPVTVGGARVSSTGLRETLARGDLEQARAWLGRPYSMIGRVMRGEQLGRKLGYPTANLRVERLRSPVEGIFAVRVHGVAESSLPGVASLGTRPAVGGTRPLLEAHIFDFEGDLYGREIEVEFVEKLRDERNFPTLDALVEQIHIDAAQARRVLNG